MKPPRRRSVVGPAELRTPDALHLVSALAFGDDLDGIVTCDERPSEAARAHALTVATPA